MGLKQSVFAAVTDRRQNYAQTDMQNSISGWGIGKRSVGQIHKSRARINFDNLQHKRLLYYRNLRYIYRTIIEVMTSNKCR